MSSSAKQTPKQECLQKYIICNTKDFRMNDNDSILFFLVLGEMNRSVTGEHLQDMTLRSVKFTKREPAEPVEHPRILDLRMNNSPEAQALLIRLDAKNAAEWREHNKAYESWNRLKLQFEARESKFAAIFTKHLGPTVLNIDSVAELLGREAYFEAWNHLIEYFLNTDAVNTRSKLQVILNTVYYELCVSMMQFTQFIGNMCSIYALFDGQREVTESTKIMYLCEAIKRGQGNFGIITQLVDLGGNDWKTVQSMFVNQASKQKKASADKSANDNDRGRKPGGGGGNRNTNKQFEANHSEQQPAKKGKKGKKPGKCNSCGKSDGHWKGDPECENYAADKAKREAHNAGTSQSRDSSAPAKQPTADPTKSAEFLAMQAQYIQMASQLQQVLNKQQRKDRGHEGHQALTRAYKLTQSLESEDDEQYTHENNNAVRGSTWFSAPSGGKFAGPREFHMHVRFQADWRSRSSLQELPSTGTAPGIAAFSPSKKQREETAPQQQVFAPRLPAPVPAPALSAVPRWHSSGSLGADVDSFFDKHHGIAMSKEDAAAAEYNALIASGAFTPVAAGAAHTRGGSDFIASDSDNDEDKDPSLLNDVSEYLSSLSNQPQQHPAVSSSEPVETADTAAVTVTDSLVATADDDSLNRDVDALLADMDNNQTARNQSSSATASAHVVNTEPVFHLLATRKGKYQMEDTLAKNNKAKQQQQRQSAASSSSSDGPEAHMVRRTVANIPRSDKGVKEEIFDSGATDHMAKSTAGLTNLRPFTEENSNVYMGGNKNFGLPIVGRGVDGILSDVLVVPQLKRSLISSTTLMADGYIQLLYRDRLLVFGTTPGLPLLDSGTLVGDKLIHRDVEAHGPPSLHEAFRDICTIVGDSPAGPPAEEFLPPAPLPSPAPPRTVKLAPGRFSSAEELGLTDRQFLLGKAVNRPANARALVPSEMAVLHHRTMHAGQQKLYHLARNRTAIGICATLKELQAKPMGDCIACHLGKFSKFPAPPSFSRLPTAPMSVICSDIKGPFRIRSVVGHHKYFQLHADPVTEHLWVNFHTVKSTVGGPLMSLQLQYAEPLGLKIRFLQSDSDALYKDSKLKTWAASNGVTLQYTAPYRHEGTIEARMKSVLDMTRTVLADSGLSEEHWETIVEAAVYVLNRLPTSRNPQTCPLTALTGKVPDISHLVPLGYPATVKIYDEEASHRTTLEPKAEECVVVGYAPDDNSYKVVTKSGRFLLRKDVVVDENWSTAQRRPHKHVQDVLLLEPEEPASTRDDIDVPAPQPVVKSVEKPAPPADPPPALRRSTRWTIKPDRLAFASEKTPLFADLPEVPRTVQEALQSKDALSWLTAINAEFTELIDRGVIVPLEPGEKGGVPFKSKIVFRVTRDHGAKLERMLKFKARVVARGFSSIFGVHYEESYSPTMLFKSLLIVLTIALREGWHKTNIDVGNAYLEALREKPLYMLLPFDWTGGKHIKVRLARNLYGLKDAGLLWYVLIDKILKAEGYTRSIFDPCVYYKAGSILCLFVDDLAITGNRADEVERLKRAIASQVKKLKDLGALSQFVGITMEEDGDSLLLHQLEVADAYIKEYVKQGKAVKFVPIAAVHELDKLDDTPESQWEPIWDIVGKIRYLADRTRHDLQYVASKLGTRSAKAPPRYQEAAMDVMRYLNHTKDLSLRLGGRDKTIKLFGYADASFVAGDDSRSQLGYCLFLNRDSGAVCARSIKDKTVSLSSTESEIKALTEITKEIIWMRGLLAELGYPQEGPTVVYQDNTSAIRLSEMFGSEARTRHLVNRLNFIRQEIKEGTIVLEHIPTEHMVADILTGPRERGLFEYLRRILLEGHWIGSKRRARANSR